MLFHYILLEPSCSTSGSTTVDNKPQKYEDDVYCDSDEEEMVTKGKIVPFFYSAPFQTKVSFLWKEAFESRRLSWNNSLSPCDLDF